MIASQLISELLNMEFQSKILAEAAILTSLKAKFDRLVSRESTEQSTNHLHHAVPSTPHAQKSQYKKMQSVRPQNQSENSVDRERPKNFVCKDCGRFSHPSGRSMSRKDCPALNMQCHNYGKQGHFRSICRLPKKVLSTDSSSNVAQSNISSSTS